MKRLFYVTGIAFSLLIFSSCAQHDPSSPDTSGNVPNNQPGTGIDTSDVKSPADSAGANMSPSNPSNLNEQHNSADTGSN